MKIVVQIEPDQAELLLNDAENLDFIVDQETYCHFRDEVLIKEMERFIKKKAPGKWQEMDAVSGSDKGERWWVNMRLIHKYYPRYDKIRRRFYLWNGHIYVYSLISFMNVGNEIELKQLDMEDLESLLNQYSELPRTKVMRRLGII